VDRKLYSFGSYVRRCSTPAIVACQSPSFACRIVTCFVIFVNGLRRHCVSPLFLDSVTSPVVPGVSFIGSYTVTDIGLVCLGLHTERRLLALYCDLKCRYAYSTPFILIA